jgi:hypothetical protein
MKNIIICFVLSVSCMAEVTGQRLSTPDSNKYRIDLPSYWKPGNKVWKILIDKLPLVCAEIKDKEICGDDCNPAYSFEFEMSDPVILIISPIIFLQYIPITSSGDLQRPGTFRHSMGLNARYFKG